MLVLRTSRHFWLLTKTVVLQLVAESQVLAGQLTGPEGAGISPKTCEQAREGP